MFRMQGAVGRLGRCAGVQLSGAARPLALGAGLALALALLLAGPAAAQNRAHPWIASPPRLQAEAYFTNLHDGDTVQSPFVARFGLNLWGTRQPSTTSCAPATTTC